MGVRIVPLEENLFVFQFSHIRDLRRVIDDGPWSFENHTLICKQVPSGVRHEDVDLDSIDFWVQIFDLPSMFANADFVEKVGNHVGLFKAANPNNFGGTWRSFFRIRVTLKISEPLKRRMKLRLREGAFQWVTFKYERLSTFCFCCGLLGHSDRFCRKAYEENIEPKDYPYGGWLRVGGKRQAKPVGAQWLLADLPSTPTFVPSTPATPSTNIVQVEEAVVVHADLKRRGEEYVHEGTSTTGDVNTVEVSKNSVVAGPGCNTPEF